MSEIRKQLKDKNGNVIIPSLPDVLFPIGSIYMTTELSTPAAVKEAIGGDWVRWGEGRIPTGVNSSDTDFNTVEKIGGDKTSHDHNLEGTGYYKLVLKSDGAVRYAEVNVSNWTSNYATWVSSTDYDSTSEGWVGELGGKTGTKSSLPPYQTCYMYKRIA